MSKNIGGDAAHWAGLLIDLNQKFRSGNITASHLEFFNNLSREQRDMLLSLQGKLSEKMASKSEVSAEPVVKFTLLTDLGILTVPADYNHATQLAKFKKKNHKKFYYYNDNINDANFPNPSTILVPGKRIRVKVFKQIAQGTTTSEERMIFLKDQNAFHTGAQGASLVFEQMRDKLPKGYWYASYDEPHALWESDGYRRVPRVRRNSDGDFYWDLGGFGYPWHGDDAFFCFCDE